MIVSDERSKRLEHFKVVCSNHGARYLYAFGSSVTDKFDSITSDIELLVENNDPDPIEREEKLISFGMHLRISLTVELICLLIHRFVILFYVRVLIPQRF
jgi:predicted nucleotidyltransferase